MSFEGINYQRLHENVLGKGSIMLQALQAKIGLGKWSHLYSMTLLSLLSSLSL